MIVDANVVLSWMLPARRTAATLRLLSFGPFVAPRSQPFEVGHALTKLVRQGRLGRATALDGWSVYHAAPIEHVEIAGLKSVFGVSLRLNTTFYDAGYVALAVERQEPLITLDQRLLKAARPHVGDLVRSPDEV